MIIQIECTSLQLQYISKALHLYDYSLCGGISIPKEGLALASICEEWSEEMERKKRKERGDI